MPTLRGIKKQPTTTCGGLVTTNDDVITLLSREGVVFLALGLHAVVPWRSKGPLPAETIAVLKARLIIDDTNHPELQDTKRSLFAMIVAERQDDALTFYDEFLGVGQQPHQINANAVPIHVNQQAEKTVLEARLQRWRQGLRYPPENARAPKAVRIGTKPLPPQTGVCRDAGQAATATN